MRYIVEPKKLTAGPMRLGQGRRIKRQLCPTSRLDRGNPTPEIRLSPFDRDNCPLNKREARRSAGFFIFALGA